MTNPSAPEIVLSYQSPADIVVPPRRMRRALLMLACLPAAVTPFVSFTYGISPQHAVAAVSESLLSRDWSSENWLILLAMPFFAGILISIWQLRLLIQPTTRPIERKLMWLLAIIFGLMPCAFAGAGLAFGTWSTRTWSDVIELGIALSGPCVVTIGAAWVWRLARSGSIAREVPALAALEFGFLANALVCLLAFRERPETGWWLTLIASGGMVADLLATAAFDCIRRSR